MERTRRPYSLKKVSLRKNETMNKERSSIAVPKRKRGGCRVI